MAAINISCSSLGSLDASSLVFPDGKGFCQNSLTSNRGLGKQIQLIKMASLTLIPILGLWAFCVYQITEEVKIRQNHENSIDSLAFSINVGKLVHHLQNERDLSMLYLSLIGPETKVFLLHEYTITDEFIDSLQYWPQNLDRYNRKVFRSKSQLLTHIGRHRHNIERSTIDQEHKFYSSIIDTMVIWGYESIKESKFIVIWKSVVAFQKTTMAKENLGVERAFGTMFFAKGGFETHEQYEVYNMNCFGFQQNYASARIYSPNVDYLYLYTMVSVGINASVAIDNYRKYIKEFGEEKRDPIKADITMARWHYDNVTKFLDALLNLQTTLRNICISHLTSLADKSRTAIIINSSLLVFVLLSCTFVIFYTENLTSNIQKFAVLLVDRTKELNYEKKKTDSLLYQMIPKSVARKLKRNDSIKAEYFYMVTVFFSDVEGFVADIILSLSPLRIVAFLNVLYSAIDSLVDQRNLYKVETINDSYMVVSGLPRRNKGLHASEIAIFALTLQEIMKMKTFYEFGRRHIRLRIGINSGPCMAGIVGSVLPRYCLFGDTVNVASRMKSTGLPNQIHISHSTYTLLNETEKYTMIKRGNTNIKGKGKMCTYWLKDVMPSLNGSTQLTTAISPISDTNFNFVYEMFQNRTALSQASEVNSVLPAQSLSHNASVPQLPESTTGIPTKTPPPISVEPPDFNAFKHVMGRRKTDVCVNEQECE